ncbi:hypothetical protein DAT35_29715 [Vitiosangium sp. GDMCC 1.1324]|nr:hypothetical protein DAT35_29715 [Vitiosangium sp. GDMCC 1.1324]
MAVPQRPEVYQIGCLERRVTLYSQQVRALNLVFALFARKKLQRSSRVAVVGGGAAGLTATVALARCGATVTLLERLDAVIPFQSGNLTRWLHPHIYEWPEEGCHNPDSGLPLLNWSADYAANVALVLRDEFYRHVRETKAIEIHKGVRNVKPPEPGSAGRRLEWNGPGGRFWSEPFDAVILAVGFGLEGSTLCPVQSYWRNDDLAQFELDAERVRNYLVSGCGDGGLVDLLRIRISDFRHGEILEELIGRHPEGARVEKQLLLTEEAARAKVERGEDPSDFLYDEYQRIRPRYIDDKIATRLRGDTRATLNGPDQFPWNLNSSILNRFFASALIGLRHPSSVGADWWRGKIAHIGQDGTGYLVGLENGGQRAFDRVILRHGTRAVISQWMQGSDAALVRSRNALDQTRIPAWPDGFFGEATEQKRATPRRQDRKIYVHIPVGAGQQEITVKMDVSEFSRVDGLLDGVYFALLPRVPAYTYGKTWRLRNRVSGLDLVHVRETLDEPRFGEPMLDSRSLEDVGILPGDELEVVFLMRTHPRLPGWP